MPSPHGDRRSAASPQASRNRGPNVDLAQCASNPSSLSPTQIAELVRIDQSERWERGERPLVEKYCEEYPSLALDAEAVTDIAYHEFLLREEYSESTELESFLARFPDYEVSLRDQIMFHGALRNSAQQTAWLEEVGGDSADPVDEGRPELDGYELKGLIAVGGTSSVYRARHIRLNRDVAIKLLLHAFPSMESRQRFDREARAIAKVDHENIVDVFDFGEILGRPFLVLEYVSGGPLSDHYRGHPVPSRDAAHLIATIARAIQHCHDRGIVHRDLKPGNILLEPCQFTEVSNLPSNSPPPLSMWIPKITDFGLSKLSSDEDEDFQTRTGTVFGTPSYMAPEQASGRSDPNSPLIDVYALGAILYELLTGRPPYQGTTPFDVLQQVMHEPPIAPSRLTRGLSAEIETICLKCLSHEPEHRYVTAMELAGDLDRFLAGTPILARRASYVQRLSAWSRRNPTRTAMAIMATVFFMLAYLGVATHDRRLRQSRAEELVNSLKTADMNHVRTTLDALQQIPGESRRALQAVHAEADDSSTEFSVAYARAVFGIGKQLDLVPYVPTASPVELELLAELPQRWTDAAQKSLWDTLLNEQQAGSVRLRVAAALASSASQDSRWPSVASTIATTLSRESFNEASRWLRLLKPIHEPLQEPLISILHSSNHPTSARLIAASALADFLDDTPGKLATIAVDADVRVYPALVIRLRNDPSAIQTLETVFHVPAVALPATDASPYSPPVLDYYKSEISRARRRAAAAVTLARLGHPDALQELLGETTDPTARNHATERMAASELPIQWLVTTLSQTRDAAVGRSCVLALTQYEPDILGKHEQDALRAAIASLLGRIRADSGVIAALDWLDQSWKIGLRDLIADHETSNFQEALLRGTWINQQGQAFAVLIPSKCQLGSPQWGEEHEKDERQRSVHLARPFAMARHELTVEALRRWQQDFPLNPRYSSQSRDPANNVSFFDAARYCRWLSEQEEISEDQMCFPALDEIKPGMVLPEDYAARTGYRLPTADEWEFACRGGTNVTWSFGLDNSLTNSYANCGIGMLNRTWPVGTGKPNDFGLFDMVGNVREWCINAYSPHPERRELSGSSLTADARTLRIIRGGGFGDVPVSLRSARIAAELPTSRFAIIGMRLIRTLPADRD